jgi:ABC-type transport system involved in multi-copper enzyme maturation permease subunit
VAVGILLVGSEYSSGTIRASLVAVPRRGRLYASKIAAGAAAALGVSCATAVATFFAAQAGLGPFGVHLSSPGALQGLVGSILYLTLMCLLATGLAMLLGSSALSLGILLPFLLLESQGLGNIPQLKGVMEYLPANAGMVIMHIYGQDQPGFRYPYGPWAGIGILALWTAAALLAGWLSFRSRDA